MSDTFTGWCITFSPTYYYISPIHFAVTKYEKDLIQT